MRSRWDITSNHSYSNSVMVLIGSGGDVAAVAITLTPIGWWS